MSDSRIEELLSVWNSQRAQGREPAPADLCRDTPELATELAERIAVLRRMERLVTPEAASDTAQTIDRDATPVFKSRPLPAADGVGEMSGNGQRFRIVRPHAEGGLGRVSVASDEELHREVALKEIKPQYADDAGSRARFTLEAEITGGLEHPGIVPVYGLGHYADGRPFYAMRFIRGDSLQEAVEQFHKSGVADFGGVEFRKLLGRFIDVCQAIEYAHSRGVLHRDLKPGNIMLGKYGETLVVDWGLAKAAGKDERFATGDETTLNPSSGSAVEPTQAGSALGTPAYMSPEQGAGRLDELGPATDVYSLGATLYHVLTGRAPFSGLPLFEILARVQRGEFPRPRDVNPHLPKALQAICLKAMSIFPSQRYAGAAEIAEELERWLADEPVRAWREPLVVRARRWLKRHQTLVTGGVAAVLVGLVSLAVLAFVIGDRNRQLAGKNRELDSVNRELDGTNRELESKNTELVASNTREREAKNLAEKNELTAKDNEQFAREQSQLALQTLHSVIFDLSGGLQNLPGAGSTRRKLLATALERLEMISDTYLTRASIDRDTLAALMELGDVILRIGTDQQSQTSNGHPFDSLSLQKGLDTPGAARTPERQTALATAHRLYQRSFDIAHQIAVSQPKSAAAQADLGMSYSRLGDVAVLLGKSVEALPLYRECLEIHERQAKTDPGDSKTQRGLAISHSKLGELTLQLGKTSEALAHYRTTLEIIERRATAEPGDSQAQRDLALSYDKLGSVTLKLGKTNEALEYYQKSWQINERIATADPNDSQAQRALAVSYDNLGDVAMRLGKTIEALAHHQKSLTISAKRAAVDPNDSQAQRDLAISYERMGKLTHLCGQTRASLENYQKNLEISLKLAAADAGNSDAQRSLALSYNKLGEATFRVGEMSEALANFHKSLAITEQRAAADPEDSQAQRDLGFSNAAVGGLEFYLGRLSEALAHHRKSLEIRERRAAADPSDSEAQRELALSHDKMGHVTLQLGQANEALVHYQKSSKIREKRDVAEPGDSEAQEDLESSHRNIGKVLLRLGKAEEALVHLKRSLETCEKRAATNPGDSQAQRDLAHSHIKMGDVTRQLGQTSEALSHYQAALELSEKRVTADPSDFEAQRDLAVEHEMLGHVSLQLGKTREALAHFEKGLEICEKRAADSRDSRTQQDLAGSYNNFGRITAKLGQAQQAQIYFSKAIEICEKQAVTEHGSVELQEILNSGRVGLGATLFSRFQHALAREQCTKSVAELEAFKTRTKLTFFDKDIAEFKRLSATFEKLERTAIDLEYVLALTNREVPLFLQYRLRSLLAYAAYPAAEVPASVVEKWPTGRPAALFKEALLSADKLLEFANQQSDGATKGALLYDTGCCYALCLAALATLDLPDQERLRGELKTKAIKTLETAMAAGYKDAAHMAKNKDLDSLRELPEFKAVLESISPK